MRAVRSRCPVCQAAANSGKCWEYDALHEGCVTRVTLYPFSGISYEKTVQKKDPENDPQCDTRATVKPGCPVGAASYRVEGTRNPFISGGLHAAGERGEALPLVPEEGRCHNAANRSHLCGSCPASLKQIPACHTPPIV